MQIVTLTTDFGYKDYYTAVLKGHILSHSPTINLVDITHNINNYDIVQAAYIFKHTWPSFPKGSIHLISVGECLSDTPPFIVFEHKGQYFIGPNNGIFSLVFDSLPAKVYALTKVKDKAPEAIYALTIQQLASGQSPSKIGQPVEQLVERIALQAVISPSQIRGSVIYVDNYENVILNIDKALFKKVGRNRPFSLYFKRNDPITKLSRQYTDVAVGDTLCLFNAADYLEIAINMGKASSMLGLKVEDTVQINFHN
jgi:hypothetical protein